MEQRLEASSRAGIGKGVARKLRAAGSVPGVLYGQDTAPIQIAVDARDLSRVLHTGAGSNVLVDLVVDGKEHLAMPREVQRDRIRDTFIHVDFLAVSRTQKVTVTVPIRLVGTAIGVKEGGILDHHLWEVSISCLPGDVPEHVDADVSGLGIGDHVSVGDLAVPASATVLTNPDETIASVVVPAAVEAAAPTAPVEGEAAAAAGAAPAAEPAGEGGEG
ncbi:MAG: 50S ribosomal protein L25/general stress protein Ctc [Actinomycetota bacterium]